ncbi:hypothetical protein FOL47_009658 [Perkinsus chesapeaki]|uniref:Uncharacterized protein n=1 Tax=Perkinsus chesapeaki TaxID=330153 RepID=A0A7J6MT82_PERCH|nr:hypothetical protein FOL47_009658 [Perkinsus chesapeaki]
MSAIYVHRLQVAAVGVVYGISVSWAILNLRPREKAMRLDTRMKRNAAPYPRNVFKKRYIPPASTVTRYYPLSEPHVDLIKVLCKEGMDQGDSSALMFSLKPLMLHPSRLLAAVAKALSFAVMAFALWGCDLPDTGTCTQEIGHDRFISIKRQNDDPDHGPFELDSFSCGQGKAFTRVYLTRSHDLMQLFTPPEATGLTTCKDIFEAALAHAEDVRHRKQKKFWFDGTKKVTWEGVLNTLCITAEGTDDSDEPTPGGIVAPMAQAAPVVASAAVPVGVSYPTPSAEELVRRMEMVPIVGNGNSRSNSGGSVGMEFVFGYESSVPKVVTKRKSVADFWLGPSSMERGEIGPVSTTIVSLHAVSSCAMLPASSIPLAVACIPIVIPLTIEVDRMGFPLTDAGKSAVKGLLISSVLQGSLGVVEFLMGDLVTGFVNTLMAGIGMYSTQPQGVSWLPSYTIICFINGSIQFLGLIERFAYGNGPIFAGAAPLILNYLHLAAILHPVLNMASVYYGWQLLKELRDSYIAGATSVNSVSPGRFQGEGARGDGGSGAGIFGGQSATNFQAFSGEGFRLGDSSPGRGIIEPRPASVTEPQLGTVLVGVAKASQGGLLSDDLTPLVTDTVLCTRSFGITASLRSPPLMGSPLCGGGIISHIYTCVPVEGPALQSLCSIRE